MASHRDLIDQAMTSKGKVKITYRDYHRRITTRTIEPLQWVGYDKFLAFCHLRNENRHFRMFNIVSCEPVSSYSIPVVEINSVKPAIHKWKSSNMDLVYKSHFTRNEEGWYTGEGEYYKYSIRDGKYLAKVKGNNSWRYVIHANDIIKPIDKINNYEIEVTLQFTSPNIYWASLGLIFNEKWRYSKNESDFCVFAITNNGYYWFSSYHNGKWSEIIPSTFSNQIKIGFQLNKLHIKQHESQIYIGANGFELASFWFDQFSGKGIGLYIQSGNNSYYAAGNYSDLCVYYGNKGIIFTDYILTKNNNSETNTPRLSKFIMGQENIVGALKTISRYKVPMKGDYFLPNGFTCERQLMIGWGRIIKKYILPENKILVIAKEKSGVIDQKTREVIWQIVCSTSIGRLSPHYDVLALSSNSNIHIFNLANGNYVTELTAHESRIKNLIFSSSGRSLLSYDEEGKIIIWNLINLTSIQETVLFAENIISCNFDHSSNYLLVILKRKAVVYSIDKQAIVFEVLEGLKWGGRFFDIIFHPNGNLICYTNKNGMIHFYNLVTGEELEALRINDQINTQYKKDEYFSGSLIFSKDGKYILSHFSDDHFFHIFDLTIGKEIAYIDRKDKSLSGVKLITFDTSSDIIIVSWDGGFVYSGRNAGFSPSRTIVNGWRFSDGKFLFEKEVGHWNSEIYFDKDLGEIVIDKTRLLNKEGQEKIRVFYLGEGAIKDFDFTPDGSKLIISGGDYVRIIELISHKIVNDCYEKDGFGYINITSDGKQLATIRDSKLIFLQLGNLEKNEQSNVSTSDRFSLIQNKQEIVTIRSYLDETGRLAKDLVKNSVQLKNNKKNLFKSTYSIRDYVFSPCKRYFIPSKHKAKKYSGFIEDDYVYSLITGKEIIRIPDGIYKFNFHGKVATILDGELIIVDPENERFDDYEIKLIKKDSIFDLSPDCKTLALFDDPNLVLIDIKSDKVIKTIELSNTNINDITISPKATSALLKLDSEAYLLVDI